MTEDQDALAVRRLDVVVVDQRADSHHLGGAVPDTALRTFHVVSIADRDTHDKGIGQDLSLIHI